MPPTRTATDEEISAIRLANERFYRALCDQDIEAMDQIWSQDEGARCIHPGWEIIEGWDVVRQSWEMIFSNSGRLNVEPSEVKVRVEGEMAYVSCLESITSGADSEITLARATNLFVRTPSGWKLVLHHASQVPPEARGSAGEDDEDDAEPTVH